MAATTPAQRALIVDAKSIKKAFSIYRAIHHSVRLQIIEIIHKAGKINVTPIIRELKLEQSLISAHLKILREAKIVQAERKGNNVFYSINYAQVNHISMLAERLIPYRTDPSNFLQNADRNLTIKSKGETVTFSSIELKIIRLICEENSEKEIAGKLDIGKRTVEEYRDRIIKKMKVRNSVGILFFAIRKGLFRI